jgi:oligoribonuclease (3'-5' exoribonuclease)
MQSCQAQNPEGKIQAAFSFVAINVKVYKAQMRKRDMQELIVKNPYVRPSNMGVVCGNSVSPFRKWLGKEKP